MSEGPAQEPVPGLNSTLLPLRPPSSGLLDPAKDARPAIAIEAFINSVERLERLIDRETAMLKRHEPVA
ncbi:MAG: hypothetical protein L0Y57_06570, partial [Beijerinckiaceae bacterium]|nr:hypothetical protein [Beijerinckiaceae bacterium]